MKCVSNESFPITTVLQLAGGKSKVNSSVPPEEISFYILRKKRKRHNNKHTTTTDISSIEKRGV